MTIPKIKVLTVVGTRPEIIRLSRVMALLDESEVIDHILVHTGQNYDYELNEIFFKDLEIRNPDYFLEIDTTSLGSAVGDIMRKSETVLKKERPDAMLVLGDTNSCLAAYIARRMQIPVFHMEAGNRCFDENVPEETNRRVIDHISDFNLVYTEHARRHLIAEGIPQRRIYLTGSPMREVLGYYQKKTDASGILKELFREEALQAAISNQITESEKKYFLVSFHREENVDNPQNLKKILAILDSLANQYKLPVIVSTHPRTRKRMEELKPTVREHSTGTQGISTGHPLIHFLKPFGFTDYVHLQQHALCVLSDSGTISEESAIIGFPAVSIRESMERPEAQDAGTIILTGLYHDTVLNAVSAVISEFSGGRSRSLPEGYEIKDTSWRVLKLIIGNLKLSHIWNGIKQKPL